MKDKKVLPIWVMIICSILMMVCAIYAQDEFSPSTAYKMAACGFVGLVASVIIYVEYIINR